MDKPESAPSQLPESVAMPDPGVPEVYVSGFNIGYSNADVLINYQRNGKYVLTTNMSYTLAKTLAELLGNVVAEFEATVGFEIKTTQEIDSAMSQRSQSTDEKP